MLKVVASALGLLLVSGCSGLIPNLPRDRSLPVQEILEHAACELQDAFRSLNTPQYERFKADRWLISMKLTPKVDTDVTGAGGWSSKHPGVAGKLLTWTVGSPGLQVNAKGNRTGGITYTIKSYKLIADTTTPCDRNSRSYHSLARHLGIGDWLRRTVSAMDGVKVTDIDGPTYTSQITIKYSANGSYSFVFPAGSNAASLSGSYAVDEQLQITMSRIDLPKSFTIISLPFGDNFGARRVARVEAAEDAAVQDAKNRTELLHLEQAIRSLNINQ